jgi:hypothetical protein
LRLSDLQYLMHQLGPATPEIVTIVQDDIDSWQVEFDEGVSLHFGWQETPPRLLLSCAIGQPLDDAREQVYASLLNANLLLTGVANVKLALSQPDGDVMLIGEYDIASFSMDSLQSSVSDFLCLAAKYSTMVAEAFAESPPIEADHLSAMRNQRA